MGLGTLSLPPPANRTTGPRLASSPWTLPRKASLLRAPAVQASDSSDPRLLQHSRVLRCTHRVAVLGSLSWISEAPFSPPSRLTFRPGQRGGSWRGLGGCLAVAAQGSQARLGASREAGSRAQACEAGTRTLGGMGSLFWANGAGEGRGHLCPQRAGTLGCAVCVHVLWGGLQPWQLFLPPSGIGTAKSNGVPAA